MPQPDRKIHVSSHIQPTGIKVDHLTTFNGLSGSEQQAYVRALANQGRLDELPKTIQARFRTHTVIAPQGARIQTSSENINGANVHGLKVQHNGQGHIEIHTDRNAGIQAVASELRSRASSAPSKPSLLDSFKELLTGGRERQEIANRIYGDKTIAGQSAPSGLVTNADMKAYRNAERLGRSVAKAQSKLVSRQPNNVEIDSRSQIDAGDYTAEVARQTAASQHLPGVDSWFTKISDGLFGGTIRETITLDTNDMSHWQAEEYRSYKEESRQRDLRDSIE